MSHAPLVDARLARMTLEEWAALEEDQPGELVDGYLVEGEVPDNVHELIIAWLIIELGSWGRSRGVVILSSGAKYAVARDRGRMPDVSVFLPDSARPPIRGLNRAPPTIAVEIVSPTPRDARRDRVEKLAEYAAFGVRWYWLVDPEIRSLQILKLDADGFYKFAASATDGVIDPVPGCEGLALDVGALWREVDTRLADE